MDDMLKAKVIRLKEKIGYKKAELELMKAGLSSSMAAKLLAGVYDHEIKPEKQEQIKQALKAG